MRHLAAYLLLVAGGNSSPTADDITTLLGNVGITVDEDRLKQLISELEGKDINEIIESGKDKLLAGGFGGGGGAVAAAPAGGSAPAAAEKAPEKPKVEEVVLLTIIIIIAFLL
jgi:large subunit ribosomal protein LP2